MVSPRFTASHYPVGIFKLLLCVSIPPLANRGGGGRKQNKGHKEKSQNALSLHMSEGYDPLFYHNHNIFSKNASFSGLSDLHYPFGFLWIVRSLLHLRFFLAFI